MSGRATPAVEPEPETLEGAVEHIVYRSEDTGYTVCHVRARGHAELVTVVGTVAAIWGGENVRVAGRWIRHPRHGYQFQADEVLCLAPATVAGIERYLASGMLRGIRKELARRVVEAFGERTLDVIDRESVLLEQVEGIGPVRRKMIKESWDEQKAVRDIMIFLQSHGIGVGQATRIHRQYGGDAVALVKENPYRLAQDVWGIGFLTADRIAMSLGIPRDSDMRLRAGVIHALNTWTDEGHCFCPREMLVAQSAALLEVEINQIESALAFGLEAGFLLEEADAIYPRELHQAECAVAQAIGRLLDRPQGFRPIEVERALPWASERMGIDFAPSQADAVRMALREKVSIITGGPGVGKTTIVRALVDVFRRRNLRLILAAPTGRAAKRLEEATKHESKTVHRALRYVPELRRFEHGPDMPLEADVVIVDEVSMLDVQLAARLFESVPPQATLVLVGDADQLPSVGPGNVLRDLIGSGVVPSVALTTIFRQQERSWIVQNAHRVNEGEFFDVPPAGESSDFFFLECGDADDAVRRVVELVTERIPRKFGLDPVADVQVLTPMRRNQLGSINLNAVLQERLNPSGRGLLRFGRHYREGDRLIQVRNNYDKVVFNGDIGVIREVDAEAQSLRVDYDGRVVEYESNELDEVELAYACSIHKSQGSEYPAVVIVMTTQHYRLLQRNLLYTAITRGRRLVCLVGTRKAVGIAIRNNEILQRRTGLRERLQAAVRG